MHNVFWKRYDPLGSGRSNYQAEKDIFSTAGQPKFAFFRSSQSWLHWTQWPDALTTGLAQPGLTQSGSVPTAYAQFFWSRVSLLIKFFLNVLLWEFLWGQYYSLDFAGKKTQQIPSLLADFSKFIKNVIGILLYWKIFRQRLIMVCRLRIKANLITAFIILFSWVG